MSNGKDKPWKDWGSLKPGQLKHEIEQAFANAPPGEYPALEIKIENPITGYRIMDSP